MLTAKVPVKKFLWRSNCLSSLRFPIHEGILPLKLQLAINKASRLISFDTQDGISADSKSLPPVYSPKLNNFKLVRFPMLFGIKPLICRER